jgi:hypothetical protein
MSDIDPSTTRYVVVRPAGDVSDSKMASIYEGEWRKREDLADDSYIELDSPHGPLRAMPTSRTEVSGDGALAQVYEVDAPLEDPNDAPD